MVTRRTRDGLLELVGWLQEENGPVTDEERATAQAELREIDAEHDRRAGSPAG
ncbi:hypothetical protein GTZ89_23580 [Streptomyces sp. SID8382]|uniref:hypothetical protein n=1 Tax=Streptomyces malaysiensis TaxID=92644 RepID=UPI000CA28A1C|nr:MULTISPECIES: hypothetical protein [Streptomyces]AUA14796.1 hypothetical protein CFP59_06978 [Streptomyces sp. M56]MYX58569.1 hypothetical protein [Streptomyces sp. SID8382]